MYLRKRVGTPSDPADPALHREARRRALRLRGRGVGMPDAAHRAERALWLLAADAAHAERRALPRERPPIRQPALRAGRSPCAPPLERTVHRGRRRGLVEVRRSGLGPRAREVREREPHLARRRRRRITSPSRSLPTVDCEAARARDSAVPDRAHDRVPDRAGRRRARGAEATLALVRGDEVAGAGGTSDRAGAQVLARLVMGLGAARRALGRPGQDVRGVRLALVARRGSLRRARNRSERSSMPTFGQGN